MSVNNFFVYGTLLHDQMVKTVIGRIPASRPARLKNWMRYSIRDCPYPAIAPKQGVVTEGKLLLNLTNQESVRLDDYEGDEYNRIQVQVETTGDDGSNISMSAFTYAWKQPDDEDLFGSWEYDVWKKNFDT